MNRNSLRMKGYRPISADFTKAGTLGSMFGINNDPNDKSSEKNSGVLLINCKSEIASLPAFPI